MLLDACLNSFSSKDNIVVSFFVSRKSVEADVRFDVAL